MPVCEVHGCGNRTYQKNKKQKEKENFMKISFHRFPKDPERLKQWLQFLNREGWKPVIKSVICSEHFIEQYFDKTSKSCIRLRENAVPTILKPSLKLRNSAQPSAESHPENLLNNIPIILKSEHKLRSSVQPSIESHTENLVNSIDIVNESSVEIVQQNPPNISQIPDIEQPINVAHTTEVSLKSNVKNEEHTLISTTTSVSPVYKALPPISPAQQIMINMMKEMKMHHRNKIRLLQQTIRRQAKKITSLKQILSNLRNQKNSAL